MQSGLIVKIPLYFFYHRIFRIFVKIKKKNYEKKYRCRKLEDEQKCN